MINIFKKIFGCSSEIDKVSNISHKPNISKEDVLKEIYSLEPIKNYISKNEEIFFVAKNIREKYFSGNYPIIEMIERFAIQELGYKFVYTGEKTQNEISWTNRLIFYHCPICPQKRHYKDMLHLCIHIYKKHTTKHEFGKLLYDNEYIKKSENEAFFLAHEILYPFEELLEKIAELYSKRGKINVSDIDEEYASYNSLLLSGFNLEKYIDLEYRVFYY